MPNIKYLWNILKTSMRNAIMLQLPENLDYFVIHSLLLVLHNHTILKQRNNNVNVINRLGNKNEHDHYF